MTKTEQDQGFMDLEEAAVFLSVSPRTLTKMVNLGLVPVSMLEHRPRFWKDSLLKYMVDECGNKRQGIYMQDSVNE